MAMAFSSDESDSPPRRRAPVFSDDSGSEEELVPDAVEAARRSPARPAREASASPKLKAAPERPATSVELRIYGEAVLAAWGPRNACENGRFAPFLGLKGLFGGSLGLGGVEMLASGWCASCGRICRAPRAERRRSAIGFRT